MKLKRKQKLNEMNSINNSNNNQNLRDSFVFNTKIIHQQKITPI